MATESLLTPYGLTLRILAAEVDFLHHIKGCNRSVSKGSKGSKLHWKPTRANHPSLHGSGACKECFVE